jgi:hypothetical protein
MQIEHRLSACVIRTIERRFPSCHRSSEMGAKISVETPGRVLNVPLKHKSPRSGPLQNVQTAEPFGAMNGLTIADAVSLRDSRVTFCGQKSSCLQFAIEQAT